MPGLGQLEPDLLILAVGIGIAGEREHSPDGDPALDLKRQVVGAGAAGGQSGSQGQGARQGSAGKRALAGLHQAMAAKQSRKALRVASMSASLWAREVNPASKALGAR